MPVFSVMFSDQQRFAQENQRNSDYNEDFFIFSITDFQYKALRASVPSPYTHTFSLLMKVTQQYNSFATLLGLDFLLHSCQCTNASILWQKAKKCQNEFCSVN